VAHSFKKRFGQNFLKNTRFAGRLVEVSDPTQGDEYIEIGPGDGNITEFLLSWGVNVTSVEVDYDLIPKLIKRFDDQLQAGQMTLVHKDILQIEPEFFDKFKGKSVKVIGSLPYNISKKIMNVLLTYHEEGLVNIASMTFIVQEEVAQDIVSKPPKATFFGTMMHIRSKVKKFESIPARHFFPTPKVNGGILQIVPTTNEYTNDLIRFIKLGYSSPRKQLVKNFTNSNKYTGEQLREAFKEVGIIETARAQELEVEHWIELYKKLNLKKE
jgi:16S rRNA (adenine1518-N6/adenine1519-N6)-dimethyltransferase